MAVVRNCESSIDFDRHMLRHQLFNNKNNINDNNNNNFGVNTHIRQLIDKDVANTLSSSIVGCRLDYCNALLNGKTQKNFNSL